MTTKGGTQDWDARFASTPDYIFGTDPAAFVATAIPFLPPGARVLSVAEGEGRNAVALAMAGFAVTAFEASATALTKAETLAKARGVSVDFRLSKVEDWDWAAAGFDAVIGIFIQFAPPDLRAKIHAGMAAATRPGGLVMLHGYAPRQIANGTGGPRAVENMYTLDGLRSDFAGWQVLRADDYDAHISEGTGHVGLSALVDFVARKP